MTTPHGTPPPDQLREAIAQCLLDLAREYDGLRGGKPRPSIPLATIHPTSANLFRTKAARILSLLPVPAAPNLEAMEILRRLANQGRNVIQPTPLELDAIRVYDALNPIHEAPIMQSKQPESIHEKILEPSPKTEREAAPQKTEDPRKVLMDVAKEMNRTSRDMKGLDLAFLLRGWAGWINDVAMTLRRESAPSITPESQAPASREFWILRYPSGTMEVCQIEPPLSMDEFIKERFRVREVVEATPSITPESPAPGVCDVMKLAGQDSMPPSATDRANPDSPAPAPSELVGSAWNHLAAAMNQLDLLHSGSMPEQINTIKAGLESKLDAAHSALQKSFSTVVEAIPQPEAGEVDARTLANMDGRIRIEILGLRAKVQALEEEVKSLKDNAHRRMEDPYLPDIALDLWGEVDSLKAENTRLMEVEKVAKDILDRWDMDSEMNTDDIERLAKAFRKSPTNDGGSV